MRKKRETQRRKEERKFSTIVSDKVHLIIHTHTLTLTYTHIHTHIHKQKKGDGHLYGAVSWLTKGNRLRLERDRGGGVVWNIYIFIGF